MTALNINASWTPSISYLVRLEEPVISMQFLPAAEIKAGISHDPERAR